MNLSHDEVAEIGASWLRRNGYPIAFANMRSATHGEQPDALGFGAYGNTFMLEAKISRADFLSDKNKPWRKDGKGIGEKRGYITLEGIAKPEEIPYGWWLLEVYGNKKPRIRVVKGITREMGYTEWDIQQGREGDKRYLKSLPVAKNGTFSEFRQHTTPENYSFREELMWTIKILRRMKRCGIDIEKYARHIEEQERAA